MLNTVPPPPILNTAPPPTLLPTQQPPPQSQTTGHRTNPLGQNHHYTESKIHPSSINVPRTTATSSSNPALSSISRLAATNGEITITTSHGPTSSHSMKSSPPQNLSPGGNDSSSADLLIDSPSKLFVFNNLI